MTMRRFVLTDGLNARIAMVLALALVACGGSLLEEGKREFNAGQYADAKHTWEKLDSKDYKNLDAQTRTTYALYRGLTFGALGDRLNAVAWLGLAKQTEDQYPGTLNAEDRTRLKLADEQYGPLLPTSAPPPSD